MNFLPEPLKPIVEQQELFEQLKTQLIKDFSNGGFSIQSFFAHVASPEQLFLELKNAVVSLLEQGERNTLQVLYIIDIKEEQFFSCLQTTNPAEALTKCIIERECTKIYFRQKYK